MSFDNRGTPATPPWLRPSAPDTAPDSDHGVTRSDESDPSAAGAGRHEDRDATAEPEHAAGTHRTPPPSWLPSEPQAGSAPITAGDAADPSRWVATTPPAVDTPVTPDSAEQRDLTSSAADNGDGHAAADHPTPGDQPFDGPHQFGPPGQFGQPEQFGPPEQFGRPEQFAPPGQFGPPEYFDPPEHFGQRQHFGPPPEQFGPPPGQYGPPPGQFDGPQFLPPWDQGTPFDQQPYDPQRGEQQRPQFDPATGPSHDPGHPAGPFGAVGGYGPPPGAQPDHRPPGSDAAQAPPMGPPISPSSDPFGPPAGGAPGFAPQDGQYGHQGGGPGSLDEVALLRKARRAPHSGWRRAVHKISAGVINPGDSPDDLYFQQLVERVNRPVRGDYRIAVLSLKGGVGKTTTTVGLGSIFSSLRGDRVIAVDANPDLGTLAQRIPQQTRSTVRDLLADTSIYRYSDVRAHTSQSPSRLEVLASERDPAVAEAFSEQDYRGVMKVLQRFYNIIITDCGTGLSHSAMSGVLDLANALILVSSPAIDGARSAGATLDWLQAHGYGHLVSRAVVVLSSSRSGASTIDTNQLSQHFLTRCRAVQSIPFDDHLAEGAEVDLELLSKPTHRALVELAATVADDFSATNLRRTDPYFQ